MKEEDQDGRNTQKRWKHRRGATENAERSEAPTPTPTLYLPDMENTTLMEAKKRAIQWGPNTDEYLVE